MDPQPKERTVVFADLAGFTALTEAHGDLQAVDAASRLYAMADLCLVGSTKVIKHIGDAVMLVSPSCDHALQSTLRLADAVAAEPMYPALRAGLHAGPTLERDGDYLGATVNLAARVAGHARAGQVLCTSEVVASTGLGSSIAFTFLEDASLKNIPHTVRIFEARRIGAVGVGPECAIDPVCQMRIEPGKAVSTIEVGGRVMCFCSRDCASKFAAAPSEYMKR